jgi:hypothetical protein
MVTGSIRPGRIFLKSLKWFLFNYFGSYCQKSKAISLSGGFGPPGSPIGGLPTIGFALAMAPWPSDNLGQD